VPRLRDDIHDTMLDTHPILLCCQVACILTVGVVWYRCGRRAKPEGPSLRASVCSFSFTLHEPATTLNYSPSTLSATTELGWLAERQRKRRFLPLLEGAQSFPQRSRLSTLGAAAWGIYHSIFSEYDTSLPRLDIRLTHRSQKL
jgi:hypothetical protein